jgi:hypothetical protein
VPHAAEVVRLSSTGRPFAARRYRLLLGLGSLVMLGLLACHITFMWFTTPRFGPPGITWKNFRQLRVGMTESCVREILGEPVHISESLQQMRKMVVWRGDEEDVIIHLIFGADNCVVWGGGTTGDWAGQPIPLETGGGPLDRLRHLLPW